MKVAVIYAGKYGTTRQYARWIAEETGGDLFTEKECKIKALAAYDTIIFGGAIHAGGILGISFLRKNWDKLAGKRIFTFAVGLNVTDEAVCQECREINLARKLKGLPCYFFRGGYDPSKIGGMDKMLMGVVRKMIVSKAPGERTASELELLEAIDHGADYTDRSTIGPLVEAVLNG